MRIAKLQQGDPITLNIVYKENGQAKELDGRKIAIGFYPQNDQCVSVVFKENSTDGTPVITRNGFNLCLFVPSTITKKFIGPVDVEMALYTEDRQSISHADKILQIIFDPRRLNKEI